MSSKVIEDYFTFHTTVLKYILYWPGDCLNRRTMFLYNFLSVIKISFIIVLYNFVQYATMYVKSGNFGKMVEESTTVFINTIHLVKMFTFIYSNKQIRILLQEIKSDTFQPETSTQREMVVKTMKNCKIVSSLFMSMCTCTTVMWGALPLIYRSGSKLPFNYWYPFDATSSPVYEFIYVFEEFGMLMIAISHVSMDAITVGTMAFVGSQIDVLNHALINLDRSDRVFTSHKNELVLRNFINCISLHKKLKRLINKVNEIFAISLFFHSALGAIVLCLAMYKLTKVALMSSEGVSYINYYIAMLTELSLYFWYGNEIILKSDRISKSVYKFDWVDTTNSFKKNMLFFMSSTDKPMQVYGGYFIILSLNSLIAILKGSWSYFAVLKSL